jgi:rod shape-determining protein MreD
MIAKALRPITPGQWILVPWLASLGASILLAAPVRVAGLQLPEPVFALVPAFAWALGKPSAAPPFALLILGLALDLLWGGAIGVWPCALLAAYALTLSARRVLAGQEFMALWGAFALACAAAFAAGFLLVAARAGHAPNLLGVGLQFLASAAMFPFAWRLLERYEATDARYR